VTSAIGLITDRVRDRVRREGVDLAADMDGALVARYVRDEVQAYSEHALGGSQPLLTDEAAVTRQVVATLTGFGPLQPFLDDPSVEGQCTCPQALEVELLDGSMCLLNASAVERGCSSAQATRCRPSALAPIPNP
jgi:hypothetical protein